MYSLNHMHLVHILWQLVANPKEMVCDFKKSATYDSKIFSSSEQRRRSKILISYKFHECGLMRWANNYLLLPVSLSTAHKNSKIFENIYSVFLIKSVKQIDGIMFYTQISHNE